MSFHDLALPRSWALTGVLVRAGVELVVLPLWSHAADHVGRRPIYAVGTCLIALYAFPFFALLDTRDSALIVLAVGLGLGVGHAPTSALNGCLYAEQFPAHVRYSGSSIAYRLSSVAAGAPAAIVAAWLVQTTGTTRAVSWYVVGASTVSLVALALLSETKELEL